MGKGGSSQETQSSGSTTRQPTAEERALTKMDLSLREKTDPYLAPMQIQGLKLGEQLLSGTTPLPGWMAGMEKGISPEITQSIVDESLRDVNTQMAGQGLMDSGTRASLISRTSGDIRRAAEEFNIGNKLNMLNLALTGQAQIQQPILGFSGNLGQRLTTTGTTTQTGNVRRYSAMGGGMTW